MRAAEQSCCWNIQENTAAVTVFSSLVSHKVSAFSLQQHVRSSNYLCTQTWHSLELWVHFPSTARYLWAASAPVSTCSSSALYWQPECQVSSYAVTPLSPRAFFLLFLPGRSGLCPEMSAFWRHLTLPPSQAHPLVYQDSISPSKMLSTLPPAARLNRPFVTTNICTVCTGVSIIQLLISSLFPQCWSCNRRFWSTCSSES